MITLLLLGCTLAYACGKDDSKPKIKTPNLLETVYVLEEGDSTEILFDRVVDDLNILYTYDENFITIQDGMIHALNEGETEVTIRNQEDTFSYTLTVSITKTQSYYIYGYSNLYIYQESPYYLMDDDGIIEEVEWSTESPDIIEVTDEGVVRGKARGNGILVARSLNSNQLTVFEISVIPLNPEGFAFDVRNLALYTNEVYDVDLFFHPQGAYEEVLWSSSDDDIAFVNEENQLVTLEKAGEVIITGVLASNENVFYQKQWVIEEHLDPMELVLSYFVEDIFDETLTVFGFQGNYQTRVLGNVFLYSFQPLNIEDRLIPLEHRNRQGSHTIPRYVVIHDTGNIASTANEVAHSNFVRNENTGVSWHYSVGDRSIFRHVPDNEHAYHSGDGGRTYQLTNTGVRVIRGIEPLLTIDHLGYFSINGSRTTVKAPLIRGNIATTADIVDSGIRLVNGLDGYYYIGNTYFSGSKISNTGGDRGGIGIEKMVNLGVNIHETWAKTAKLTAFLLVEHNLTLDDVVQHEFFSGKNCPQTLRSNQQWDYFMRLVEAEYHILRHLSEYQITVYSHNTRYINHSGRIVRLPNSPMRVEVSILIEGENYNKQTTLEIDLPSK